MKYRPDIDGLRSFAIIPVILYHAHVPGLPGGFVGVDIFFVISGYLICSLISKKLEHDDFSLITFYERRCRRIFPALFTMLAIVYALATVTLLPPDMAKFSLSLIYSTLFLSNIFFWKTNNYFDGSAELKPLLHTWSLGVEEQFYIIVPLILYAISRWSKAHYTPWFLGISIASMALSVWGLTHGPTATFYILPTRFWELAIGAITAWMPTTTLSRIRRDAIGVTGLVLIGYAITMISEESPFPGWNALFPCVGAVAIIVAGTGGQSLVSRFLSLRPLVFIGKISFSLYLWHWPLLALAKYQAGHDLSPMETTMVIATGLGFAVASWWFIETPVRLKKGTFTSRRIFLGSATVMLIVMALGWAGISTNGFIQRYPGFVEQRIPGRERYNAEICFLSEKQKINAWNSGKCRLTNGHETNTLLWGDSYAAHYAPGIVDHAQGFSSNILQYTASSCPPIFEYSSAARPNCRDFNDHVLSIIKEHKITAVIMSGRWESLFKRGVKISDIAATVRRLQSMGLAVYVIGQSPIFSNTAQILFVKAGGTPDIQEASAPVSFRSEINTEIAAAIPESTFIDPLQFLCTSGDCFYRKSGKFIVIDSGHYSSFGSDLAVESYFPLFSKTSTQ
jgi:peptidoglycan/LPS O-acetylase OafA/YrhL